MAATQKQRATKTPTTNATTKKAATAKEPAGKKSASSREAPTARAAQSSVRSSAKPIATTAQSKRGPGGPTKASAGVTGMTTRRLDTVRLNFDIDPAIHKRIRYICVEREITIADWMRELIDREFERLSQKAK